MIKTADLCDIHIDKLQIADPIFRDYGGRKIFNGPIVTVKVYEDNVLVRRMLENYGHNQVLVVDGGGSTRCALVGDRLAALALSNSWAGIVINGSIRDSAAIANIQVGMKALNTCPVKSNKRGEGQKDVQVKFAGVYFLPGHYLYADEDGIVISETKLG